MPEVFIQNKVEMCPIMDPISQLHLDQSKTKPILKLVEKGYIYGRREVGVIECSDENVTKEIYGRITKLNEALKDKELADNRRSWAKATALFSSGGFFAWRRAVNDLNSQKNYVSSLALQVMSLILDNQDKLNIIHTTDKGERINVKEDYLTTGQDRLFKFFNEGRALFV